MTSKLVPFDMNKAMVIREVVPRTLVTFSAPFLRFGQLKVGGRGTVVRLQSGSLAVFSPTALTDEVKQKVSELGEVKYIAALDLEHHIYLGPWHAAYPSAQVIGPEGLLEKRKKQGNEDVPFTHVFSDNKPVPSISPEFDAEFSSAFVPEHVNKELAFLHKPTKSLILADLLFNLPAHEQFSKTDVDPTTGILSKIFSSLNSVHGNGQKRFIWYLAGRSNRQGFAKNVTEINGWDFDRIVPCHGDVIENNAKGAFQNVMEWFLDLSKKRT